MNNDSGPRLIRTDSMGAGFGLVCSMPTATVNSMSIDGTLEPTDFHTQQLKALFQKDWN